jgi:hypothetical protein
VKKKELERIFSESPGIIKNIGDYLKSGFDGNSKDIITNSSGTTGILLKLFAQPLVDRYFEKVKKKKLENYGLRTYFKAALYQANKSVDEIQESRGTSIFPSELLKFVSNSFLEKNINVPNVDTLLIFQPKYHPAVQFVRTAYNSFLTSQHADGLFIKEFNKIFNNNIEKQVIEEFGIDYEKHIEETFEFRLKDTKAKLLLQMKELSKIGFKESENLFYQETFGNWKSVSTLKEVVHEMENDHSEIIANDIEGQESALIPVRDLIDDYFSSGENCLEKILFIVADFGKGKSVFLKRYASELASHYLEYSEGYIPVYFNLRNFNKYSSETKLGVIGDYLETEFGFKIDDESNVKDKYIFLIDSLDESGVLTRGEINKVISSVKKIQNIDKTLIRENRIIITSRPFDDGLEEHLNAHLPKTISNSEGREITYYLSVYGFKRTQFNNWLINSIKSHPSISEKKFIGVSGALIRSIINNDDIDIHYQLLENGTLSSSELRRPIFAYMIYQLMINEIDFFSVGKIGVYLSFLNLLTREAKHIYDKEHKINLYQQFESRNILHSTAALWQINRKKGGQGSLKKADICRVIEGQDKKENDQEILNRYKGQGINEIEFLSHSYFGENDNILHFQHQSFAEILLAEYYLKVFIKFSLDEEGDLEEARIKLNLGEPTAQTITFFIELLTLLRETSVEDVDKIVMEKRKLLFPLLSSISTSKNNKQLFCNTLFYSWFKNHKIDDNLTDIPVKFLENWYFDKNAVHKLTNLAKQILESKTNYIRTDTQDHTSLYTKDILSTQNKLYDITFDIDKWLGLVVGNICSNDEKDNYYFCAQVKSNFLIDLIRNWNYSSNTSAPTWAKEYFKGINISKKEGGTNIAHMNMQGLNFSHGYFADIFCFCTFFLRTDFSNCTFENVNFNHAVLVQARFRNIKIIGNLHLAGVLVTPLSLIGESMSSLFSSSIRRRKSQIGKEKSISQVDKRVPIANSIYLLETDLEFSQLIIDLLVYLLQNRKINFSTLKKLIKFESRHLENRFMKNLTKEVRSNSVI